MRRKRHDHIGIVGAMDDPDLPKYSIAVAAEISGVPQQQLRRLEDSGLITPQRSQGNTRLYSDNDLRQIAAVSDLAEEGVNAAGMRIVLELRAEVEALRAEVQSLRRQLVAGRDGGDVSDQPSQQQAAPSATPHPSAGASQDSDTSAPEAQ